MTEELLPLFFFILGQGRYVPSRKEGTVLLSEPLSVPSECTRVYPKVPGQYV